MVDLTDPHTVTWRNPPLRVFHGTDIDSANAMIKVVRLPAPTRAGGWDFGQGVYFSASRDAAEEWAASRAVRRRSDAQVVEILVSRSGFGALRSIAFLDPPRVCDPTNPFWQYVNFCRSRTDSGRPEPSPSDADPYDIAIGPVVFGLEQSAPYIESRTRPRAFQICFKTKAAVDLLNDSRRQPVGP